MTGSSEGSSGMDFMKRGRDSSSASFSSGDFAFGSGCGKVAAMLSSTTRVSLKKANASVTMGRYCPDGFGER